MPLKKFKYLFLKKFQFFLYYIIIELRSISHNIKSIDLYCKK